MVEYNKLLYIFVGIIAIQVATSQNAFAYLDPGTGSYVFQVVVAALIGGLFTIRLYWQKIKNTIRTLFFRKQQP